MDVTRYINNVVRKIEAGQAWVKTPDIVRASKIYGIPLSRLASDIRDELLRKNLADQAPRFMKTLELLAAGVPPKKVFIIRHRQSEKGKATREREIDTKKGKTFSLYATYYAQAVQAGLKPQQAASAARWVLSRINPGLLSQSTVAERKEAARFAERFYGLPKTKEKIIFGKRRRRR